MLLKTTVYKKSVQYLPKKELLLLKKQETLLAKDIFSPTLHTKKLKGFGTDHVYSFRVTRTYRGIFRVSGEDTILFMIGHRKDIYKSL